METNNINWNAILSFLSGGFVTMLTTYLNNLWATQRWKKELKYNILKEEINELNKKFNNFEKDIIDMLVANKYDINLFCEHMATYPEEISKEVSELIKKRSEDNLEETKRHLILILVKMKKYIKQRRIGIIDEI